MVDGKFVNDGNKDSVVYIMYVIEYQHRGLPHAHIVCQLRKSPPKVFKDDDDMTVKQKEADQIRYIDGYEEMVDGKHIVYLPNIVAYRPGKVGNPTSADHMAQNIYDELVGEHMLHKCSDAENGCILDNGKCKRNYDSFVENDATSYNEKGYPLYKRPFERDLKVVPHNVFMILDWCGHVCVEYATSVKSCLYLYSYLFKGTRKDKVVGTVNNNNDEDDIVNENQIYINGRFLCSMDATGRVLGYCNYPKQTPNTVCIAVKREADVNYFTFKNKVCNMYVYMNTRHIEALEDLTFVQFFKQYYYSLQHPSSSAVINEDYYVIRFRHKNCYIKRYVNQVLRLVRIESILPDQGEPYYLRLILKNRAINRRGWYDTYCFPYNVKHDSYQAAAKAAGYLDGELYDEGIECFTEAAMSMIITPARLRQIFAMLTVNGFHTYNIILTPDLLCTMLQDFIDLGNPDYKAFKMFQIHIRKLLKLENKELKDYGLHINIYNGLHFQHGSDTELQEYQSVHTADKNLKIYIDLSVQHPLTNEQKYIFDDVTEYVISKENKRRSQITPTYLCIHGAGGTGNNIDLFNL